MTEVYNKIFNEIHEETSCSWRENCFLHDLLYIYFMKFLKILFFIKVQVQLFEKEISESKQIYEFNGNFNIE